MATFKYQAVTDIGETVNGTINAPNIDDAADLLNQQGYYVTELTPQQQEAKDIKEMGIFLGKVSKKTLSIFCQQFGVVLEAGVPMIQSLEILIEQMSDKQLKSALYKIYEDVQGGTALSVSMGQFPRVFPNLLVHMVRAGEMSGTLDDAFKKMAIQYEKGYKIDKKVTNAMIYPAVLAVVSVAVVCFLMIKVVPTFETLFSAAGGNLPKPTQILIGISDYLAQHGIATGIVVAGLILLISIWTTTKEGRKTWHTLLLGIPVLKEYLRNVLSARFTRTLGTLVSAGVSLEESLDVLAKLLNNAVAESAINESIEAINNGNSLGNAIQKQNIFPIMVTQMIKVGEQAGSLDDMLNKTADFYETEVENSVQQLTAMLEPAIVVVLGGIVAFIVLAILLPVFDMYSIMG